MGLKAAEEDGIIILGARCIRSEVDAPAKTGWLLALAGGVLTNINSTLPKFLIRSIA